MVVSRHKAGYVASALVEPDSMHLLRSCVYVLLLIGACNCDNDEVIPIKECNLRTPCGPAEAFRNGSCVPARCSEDGDCCAGRRCAAAGKCSPVEERCGEDADCEGLGVFCLEEEGTRRCRPATCDHDTDCDMGACFEGRCLVDVPCPEACASGSYCDIPARRCVVAPPGAQGCDEKCPDGQRKMLADPITMRGDTCCDTECVCKDLPTLQPRDLGLHLSAKAAAGRILVAAYERHYGDLVLISLDSSGNSLGRTFIDGFQGDQPRDQTLDTEPGPHVGLFPSMAIAAGGKVYVAYRDLDGKALKLAWQDGDGWRKTIVDARGDTGFQPSLLLTADGRPQIAYRVRHHDGLTGLRLAQADRADPTASGHWRFLDVDMRPDCIEGCADGSACIALESGDQCQATVDSCGECGAGTACVAPEGEAACTPVVNRALAVPEQGIGMAPELMTTADGLLLAYGDLRASQVKLATIRGGRIFGNQVVDGAGGGRGEVEGGVGSDLAAQFDGTNLLLAYRHHLNHSIRLYSGAADLSGDRTVLDDGSAVSDELGGLDRIHGADLDLLVEDGRRAISFQDQSMADAAAWVGTSRFQNRTTRPDGFSTSLVRLDGRFYVVHARLRTDVDGVTRFTPVVTALTEVN